MPSSVELVANRCHDDELAGIAFLSSTGRAEGNECWSNGMAHVHTEGDPRPQLLSNADRPLTSPADLERAWLETQPLARWLATQPLGDSAALHLAHAVHSGGCPHCLQMALEGPHTKKPATPTLLVTVPTRHQPRAAVWSAAEPVAIYRVGLQPWTATPPASAAGTPRSALPIHRLPAAETSAWFPGRPGTEVAAWASGVARQLASEAQRRAGRETRRLVPRGGTGHQAPLWWLAVVSANEAELEAWYGDAAARGAELNPKRPRHQKPAQPVVLDLNTPGPQPLAGGGANDWLAAQLWRRRVNVARPWLMLESLLLAPAASVLGSMLAAALSLAAALAFALPGVAQALWQALWAEGATAASIHAVVPAAAAGEWAQAGERWDRWLLTGLISLAAITVLFNRLLPDGMGVTSARVVSVMELAEDWFGVLGKLARRLQGGTSRAARAWRRLLRSPRCRRAWLRRQVFGARLFEELRASPPPAALLVLRHADLPDAAQRQVLRELLALRPPRQPALVLTQMPGLSMLTGGFLELWFGSGSQPPGPQAQAFVLHDPASAHLAPGGSLYVADVPAPSAELAATAAGGPKSFSSFGTAGIETSFQLPGLAASPAPARVAPPSPAPPTSAAPSDWHAPPPAAEASRSDAVLRRLARLLGWQPRVATQEERIPDDWYTLANDLGAEPPTPGLLPLALVLGSTPSVPLRLSHRNRSAPEAAWLARVGPWMDMLGLDAAGQLRVAWADWLRTQDVAVAAVGADANMY